MSKPQKQKPKNQQRKLHPNIDIIEGWALIEADFQREYGIDLSESLSRISWRRFTILLQGLSRESVFIIVSNSEANEKAEDNVMSDEQASALMGALAK